MRTVTVPGGGARDDVVEDPFEENHGRRKRRRAVGHAAPLQARRLGEQAVERPSARRVRRKGVSMKRLAAMLVSSSSGALARLPQRSVCGRAARRAHEDERRKTKTGDGRRRTRSLRCFDGRPRREPISILEPIDDVAQIYVPEPRYRHASAAGSGLQGGPLARAQGGRREGDVRPRLQAARRVLLRGEVATTRRENRSYGLSFAAPNFPFSAAHTGAGA